MTEETQDSSSILQYVHLDPASAVPLAVQLQQQLIWLIASGDLHPGERLLPIRQFAQHLGINLHTVRAAYLKLEALGFVEIHPGSGTRVLAYDPARLSGWETQTPSFTVGVLIPAVDNSLYAALIHGLEDAAADQPILLSISDTRDRPVLAQRFSHQLIARNVDALVLASCGFLLGDEVERSFPYFVYIDDPRAKTNSIQIDTYQAANLAVRHLLEHGFRKIGVVTPPLEWLNVLPAYQGYLDALHEASIYPDPEWKVETPGFLYDFGLQAGRKMLDKVPGIEAVFANGDLLAIGVQRAFQAAGRKVPQDIALVGYNNIDLAELVTPALTTVSIPMYEIGVRAMKMIQRLRSGGSALREPLVVSTNLVVRQSCGCNL